MLLSETKVTQQSHQKVLFGSVEHGCIVLQCNGGPLHADHENAITPSVDVVDALVRLPWMYQLHVAFRDRNHPARLQQSHQKPWFGPNLPTHSCGMLLKAVGSVYGDVKRAHGLLHGSWIARIARTARSCTDLHGVARTARRARRARTAQTARTARTARTLHGLHGPHGQHGLQGERVQLTPSPHYWV